MPSFEYHKILMTSTSGVYCLMVPEVLVVGDGGPYKSCYFERNSGAHNTSIIYSTQWPQNTKDAKLELAYR